MKRIIILLIFAFISIAGYSQADISVVNTDYKTTYSPGGTNVYTITVYNAGPAAATNVHVTNGIPAGVEEYDWTGPNNTFGSDDALDEIVPNIPSNTAVVYIVTMKVSGSYTNPLNSTATATAAQADPNPGNNSSVDVDTFVTGGDLQVLNTNYQTFYTPGTSVTYTLTIKNTGPLTATNVLVQYPVPAGITSFVWSGNSASGNGTIINTIPSIIVGQTVTYTVTIQIPAGFSGPLVMNPTVTSNNDPTPACAQCNDTDVRGTDIQVNLTDGVSAFTPGGTQNYVLTVKNNGPVPAVNVHITNAVPAGVTTYSWTGPGSTGGTGALNDLIPSLAVGATVTYNITAVTSTTFYSNLVSQAVVTSDTPDTVPTCPNCKDTDTPSIAQSADIVVTNTDNQNVYIIGQPITYVVTVTNNGPSTANNVRVLDAIPAGITSFSWTGSNGTSGTNVGINDLIASLASGQSVVYTITLQLPAAYTGSLTNTATASADEFDPTTANNKAADTDNAATVGADFVIVNTDGQLYYTPGGNLVYTVTVTNNGPQNANNVLITDSLPSGVTVTSWSGSNGTSGTTAFNPAIITVFPLNTSVTYTINVTVSPTFTGPLTHTINILTPTFDPNAACTQCTDTDQQTGTAANVGIVLTDNKNVYTAGTNSVYTVTVTNAGPAAALGVQVNVPIPAGITNFSWVGNNSTSGTNVALTDNILSMPAGSTIVYTITVGVPAAFTNDLVLTGTVSTTSTDPVTTNNQSADKDKPNTGADITVVNTDGATTFVPGQTKTYTITITNFGPQDAVNVTVQDNLPAGITTANWSGNGTSGTGNIVDTIPLLAAGQTVTYTYNVSVPSGFDQQTTLINTVVVNSDTVDPTPVCTQCTDVDAPTAFADIQISKTDNQTQFLKDSMVQYSITVRNAGPSDAVNVVISDPLPPGITDMSWIGSNGHSGTGAISDVIASLANGEVISYLVTVKVPKFFASPTNNLVNTVSVSSNTTDPNPNCPGCADSDLPRSNFVTVNTTDYTVEELVKDVLIASPCVNVSQIVSNTTIGTGYFHKNNSEFPFKDGVIIRSGNAAVSGGPYNDGNTSTVGTGSAGTDADLQLIANTLTPLRTMNDVSYIKFKFVPLNDKFSFNFIFSAMEYGTYQCSYGDVFAFLLTDLDTGITTNLAVVPNTTTPITVVTIRDNANNSGCPSVNPQYFGKFYFNDQANADISFRGRTVPLTAKSTVIPGHNYTIKLAVGDAGDTLFDSAVWIEGGSFNVGNPDIGVGENPAIGLNFANPAPLCSGFENTDTKIYAGTAPIPGATYSWTHEFVPVPGQNNYYLPITETGNYTVTIDYGGGCSKTSAIKVTQNAVEIAANDPEDREICTNDGNPGPYTFNVKQDAYIEQPNPGDFDIQYYYTLQDAKDASADIIPDPTNLTYTAAQLPATVYTRVTSYTTNCVYIKPIVMRTVHNQGTIAYASPSYDATTTATVPVINSTDLPAGGVYSSSPAGLAINPATGEFYTGTGVSNPGTYDVIYTIPAGTCPEFVTAPVQVVLDVQCAVTAPADFNVCSGDTFNLTATGTNPAATYNWAGPNGYTFAGANPTGITPPTAPGNYVYTVTATVSGIDCATDTMTVTVIAIPTAAFVTPSSTICTGSTATITIEGTPAANVTVTEAGNPVPYQVTLTNPATGLGNGSFTSSTLIGNTNFSITDVSTPTTPACTQTFVTPPSITISVGLPDATLTINDTTVCSNNPAGFTITGTPNATVNYTVDGTALSTTLDASGSSVLATTALAAGTTTITLVDVTSNSTPSCTKTLTGQTGTVTVIAEPTAGFTTPSPICSGTPATISFTGTPNSSVTFNDSQSNQTVAIDATGTGTYTTPFNITTTTTFTLISVTSGTTPSCLKNLSATISVSVNDLPVITQQPQSAVVCNGQPVTFTVVATGAGLTYQWYKTSLANPIASATSATYTIASPTTADIGDYFVVVSGTCSPAATSSLANLSVNQPTVITAQPAGGTYCEGDTVTLSVTATGVNLSYQWFGPNGAAITGATSPAYTITGITTAQAGSYHVDVINTCQTVSSNTVSVIVNQLPVITTQPTGVTVCQGQPVTLTASATGTGLTYQWENTTTGFTYPVSASPTLTIPVSALSDNGVFVLTVSGACPPSVTTTPVTVTVNQGPAITTQPAASTTLCEGQPFSISVTATGSNLTYQWYGPNGAAIAGATTPAYSIAAVTTADAGNYYVTVGNTDCPVITSATAVLQVNTLPVITAQPSGVTVCENDTITLTAAATGTALTYLWTNSTTGQTYVTATPVLTITPATLADNGTYTLAVSGACAPSVSTTPVQVVVNDAPAITTQPAASTVLCSGQALTLSVTATGSNLTYQWYRDTTLLTGETSPTLSIASTAVGDTGNYNVHVSGTGCPEVVSSVAAVTINQAPAITDQPDSLEICVNEPVTLSVSTSGSNLTYQWQKNNVDIPGATLSSYNIPTAQVSDSGNYRVVVSSASCPSITSTVAVVIVNPLPVASISNGTTSTICADDLADVIFTGTPNAVVSYTINGGAVETVTISPTGSTIVSTGQVSSTVTYELVSVTTGSAPLCTAPLSGMPNSVATVTVNPMPIVSLPQDGYICIDSVTGTQLAPFYTFESGLDPGRYSFQWYFNGDAIVGANGPDYAPPAEGQYRLEVTDLVTGCMGGATAPIVSSSPPVAITAAEVTTGYFEGNATVVVTVDPAGEYEYRLDDGPWQTSNTFTGIHSVQDRLYTGVHTVYARDLKACDQVEYQVFIVDYPKYFTPNGDGIHDTWNIPALSGQTNAKIYIFDRFGKLLKEISPNAASNGWDGTFNSQAMPADDYWFLVKYTESATTKEFRAHFTLKR